MLPFAGLLLALFGSLPLFAGTVSPEKNSGSPRGCSVITVSKGDSVFFGGNDDYITADSYYWVEPGAPGRYGVIWFGMPDNPQQGINETGLAYDANGLPRTGMNPRADLPPAGSEYHHYCMQILHTCATVEEVIRWAGQHRHLPYMHDQLHFADSTGDAVIISAGADGELAFTRKTPGDGFLVSTNFNVANPSNGFGYPCRRYETAHRMLGDLLRTPDPFRASDLTKVMDAIHQEGGSWTLETIVADLRNRVVYVYLFYQYDRPMILNVKAELANPRNPGPLSSLFPAEVRQEAARRYNLLTTPIRINKTIGTAWGLLLLTNLALLCFFSRSCRSHARFWVPSVSATGLLATLTLLLTANREKQSTARIALLETTGDATPAVVTITAALAIMIITSLTGALPLFSQLLLMLGLPVAGCLVFQCILLGPVITGNAARFAVHRLPHTLVTTFLSLGGVIPVALPLVNKSLAVSLLMPLTPYPILTWWAIVAVGMIPGGGLVYLYQWWAVHNGYRSWSFLASGQGEAVTPGWKKLWWWIPVSLAILFAGLAAGAALAK